MCRAGSPLSVADQAIAGLGAGTAGALIACPTELIKCRLQAQAGFRTSATHSQTGTLSTGLASMHQSGKGLATLAQAGSQAQAFSMPRVATAGTTPGAIHLGDLAVSGPSFCHTSEFALLSCLQSGLTDPLWHCQEAEPAIIECLMRTPSAEHHGLARPGCLVCVYQQGSLSVWCC